MSKCCSVLYHRLYRHVSIHTRFESRCDQLLLLQVCARRSVFMTAVLKQFSLSNAFIMWRSNCWVLVTSARGRFTAWANAVFGTITWELHAHDTQFISIALAHIKSWSNTLRQVKVTHYLSEFVFYECNFYFSRYCIFRLLCFSRAVPKDITESYCTYLIRILPQYKWLSSSEFFCKEVVFLVFEANPCPG